MGVLRDMVTAVRRTGARLRGTTEDEAVSVVRARPARDALVRPAESEAAVPETAEPEPAEPQPSPRPKPTAPTEPEPIEPEPAEPAATVDPTAVRRFPEVESRDIVVVDTTAHLSSQELDEWDEAEALLVADDPAAAQTVTVVLPSGRTVGRLAVAVAKQYHPLLVRVGHLAVPIRVEGAGLRLTVPRVPALRRVAGGGSV